MKYEGPNPNFNQSKDMTNVKVFADKQPDKRLDGPIERPKTICPDLSMRGHKTVEVESEVF